MSDLKVITVTLMPSLDRTLVTSFLALGYHNMTVEPERLDTAGRGVTISHALAQLDCETHAIMVLGLDPAGLAYRALVAKEELPNSMIAVPGPTRANTVVLDTGNKQETQITTEAGPITESALEQVIAALEEVISSGDLVVLAGDMPRGIPETSYARLAAVAHEAGAYVVMATSGPVLAEALETAPELVALRQIECESYFNYPVRVLEDVLGSAKKLLEQGAGSVLVEMHQVGSAVLVTRRGAWTVQLPDEAEGTSSGIWEALLAGFLAGRASRKSLEKSLALGAAAAAFSAAAVGHEFGSAAQIREYGEEVTVSPVEMETTR